MSRKGMLLLAGVLGAAVLGYAFFWFYTILWDDSFEINA